MSHRAEALSDWTVIVLRKCTLSVCSECAHVFVLASSVVMDTTEHSGCVVCGHWHVRPDDTDWVGGMDESWTIKEDRLYHYVKDN